MSKWKPIDSAPKDGTPILCWFDGVQPEPIVLKYVGGYLYTWGLPNGNNCGEYNEEYITHWMPLPAPPKPPGAA